MTSSLELAKFLAAPPVVLLIESVLSDSDALSNRLLQLDCSVVRTTSDAAAFQQLVGHRYDAVLVDVTVLDAVRRLKAYQPCTPVVVMMRDRDEPPWTSLFSCGPVTIARRRDLNAKGLAALLQSFKLKVRDTAAAAA